MAGDMVLARDQYNRLDDVELKAVTQVFRRTSDHIRHLTIIGADGTMENIETTDEHPFWVESRGWVDAGGLIAGDRLVSLDDGFTTEVQGSTRVEHPQRITVYNFEVQGDHTYFVADADTSFTNPVWVHNADCGDIKSRGNDERGGLLFDDGVHPTLPPFDGKKALGTLDVGGELVFLKSGQKGPAGGRTGDGFTKISNTHVEGHTAALMRDHDIRDADLYINRDPCPGPGGCHVNLAKMLPEGAVLRVHSPSGTTTYIGIPDAQ